MTQSEPDGVETPGIRSPRPGRPRDATIDTRAAQAVLTLLEGGTYRGLTLEGIAHEAQTSKPALRRRWGSLAGVVVHTFITVLGTAPTPDTGCLRCDLVTGMSNVADNFMSSHITSALPGLVSDLAADPELRATFLREYFDARRATTRAVLEHAVERGELDSTIDRELVLDLLAAPLYYRALFEHQPIDALTAEAIVDTVLNGIAPRAGERHVAEKTIESNS